ncbi:MAG: hypothetical protein Q7P63_14390 [Verrucomicrobiota bacterium JB022]|nr:hypothetical protein [Verrucomicrobiota bacterium JB022]
MSSSSDQPRSLLQSLLPLIIVGGIGALVVGALWIGLGTDRLIAWVGTASRGVQDWLQVIPPWAYWLCFALLPALGVPLTFFYLTAIPVMGAYGPAWAIVAAGGAVFANMWLSYVLTDSALRPHLQRLLESRGWSIPRLPPSEMVQTILTIRLSPMPYAMQNYLLGLSECGLRRYLTYSFPPQMLIGTLVMLMGDSILKGNFGLLILGIFLFLLLSIALRYLRRYLKAKAEPRNA